MISKLERLLSGGTVTWDRLLVTDGLSPEAVEQITAVSPAAPDRVWVVIDHDTPAGSVAVAEKQKALLDWARQTGAVFRSGRGIGYALLLESGLREGEIVLSGGAHAAAVGAAGAVGLSLPPAELAGALESGQISLSPAPPLRLAVTGPLSPYLSVRDLAWTLIRSGQCSGKAVVIRAPQLTAAQAMDLCGLLGAAGAVTALCVREDFPADETVDLTALQPMAAPPGDAARVVPAGETDGLRVNQVFIGGCGGGSLEALRETADLWRASAGGAGVAGHRHADDLGDNGHSVAGAHHAAGAASRNRHVHQFVKVGLSDFAVPQAGLVGAYVDEVHILAPVVTRLHVAASNNHRGQVQTAGGHQ